MASWALPGTSSRFSRVNVAAPHPLAVVLQPESPHATHSRFVSRIPRDFSGLRHSVLEAPPLVVSRDEIERRILSLRILVCSREDSVGKDITSHVTLLVYILARRGNIQCLKQRLWFRNYSYIRISPFNVESLINPHSQPSAK